MYRSDFICTYKLHAAEDQSEMYRIQLLQAFDMILWNDDAMKKSTRVLFDELGARSDIQRILEKARVSKCCEPIILLVDSDDFTIFAALFQYELFDLFHRCLCDIFSRKTVDPVHMDMLWKAME